MEAFRGQFSLPRLERVIAGPGTVSTLDAELDRYEVRRVLIATGRTLAASAPVERIASSLGSRCRGVFPGARQHVPSKTVGALVAALQDAGADGIVSIGGGSPIDTAKAAVHFMLAAGREQHGPVHIAVPTTLSAGEFTDVAGVTREETRVKHAISDVRIAPRTVIADPAMTLETPSWLWAASGIRALDHAIETLYSRRRHPLSEALASRSITMLTEHLAASIDARSPDALAHRGECQMAAWLAVFGVTNAGFGLSHVLGHQIGPRWNVPHGFTSAVILPHAMRFMAQRAPDRFEPIAAAFGAVSDAAAPASGASACASTVEELIRQLGLPVRLRDVGVPRGELRQIAGHVAGAIQREGPLDRPVGEVELAALLDAAF
jgi:alcohol dehydrogenase